MPATDRGWFPGTAIGTSHELDTGVGLVDDALRATAPATAIGGFWPDYGSRYMSDDRKSDATLRWRKKPVVIEAVRICSADYNGRSWNGSPFAVPGGGLPKWLSQALEDGTLSVQPGSTGRATWAIRTSEGTMIAGPGDWIIRGIHGELYPCKGEIFAATYEPA